MAKPELGNTVRASFGSLKTKVGWNYSSVAYELTATSTKTLNMEILLSNDSTPATSAHRFHKMEVLVSAMMESTTSFTKV